MSSKQLDELSATGRKRTSWRLQYCELYFTEQLLHFISPSPQPIPSESMTAFPVFHKRNHTRRTRELSLHTSICALITTNEKAPCSKDMIPLSLTPNNSFMVTMGGKRWFSNFLLHLFERLTKSCHSLHILTRFLSFPSIYNTPSSLLFAHHETQIQICRQMTHALACTLWILKTGQLVTMRMDGFGWQAG